MKILVLGATGRTGKLIVKYALTKGYHVNCLVRNSEKIAPNPNIRVFEGSTLNSSDLGNASEGCSAIISALNISRTSDFPFAPLRTPKDFLSKTMRALIEAAEKKEIERLVICSAWGVAETRKDIPFWFRWTIDFSSIKHAYNDHEKQETLLENSKLKWTIVRPVGLMNGKKIQDVRESIQNTPPPNLLINRTSVAKYMVDCLENHTLIRAKVTISKA